MAEVLKNALSELKKFFTSKEFKEKLINFCKMLVGNYNLNVVAGNSTCTDGKTIYENFNNPAYWKSGLSKKEIFYCYVADILHEYGHLDESCFEIMWAIHKDNWDASFLSTKERLLIEKEVSEYVKGMSQTKRRLLGDMFNIIDDAGMEYNQGIKRGKFVAMCFRLSNIVTMLHRKPLQEMKTQLDVLTEAILSYSIIGYTKGEIEDKNVRELFEQQLIPLCKKGQREPICFNRYLIAREIFELLLPFVKDDENYQNKSKSSAQEEPCESGGSQRQMPDQTSGSGDEKSGEKASSSKDDVENSSEHSQTMNLTEMLESLREGDDEFAQQITTAINSIENDIHTASEDEMNSLKEQMDFESHRPDGENSIFENARINVDASCPSLCDNEKYDEIVEENLEIIDIFVDYFKQLLKTRPDRRVRSKVGKLNSQKLHQHSFCTEIFYQTSVQKNVPPFSIVLLIDVSGSMRAKEDGKSRLQSAIETAIILNEVCRELNIKLTIMTHSALRPTLQIKCYKTFESTYEERGKIATIRLDEKCYNNRDGAAIRFVHDYVERKIQDNAIVLSISDGAPSDNGYSGQAAIDDTKNAVEELSTVAKVIGICITTEKKVIDAIDYIYDQNATANSLEELPATLLNEII